MVVSDYRTVDKCRKMCYYSVVGPHFMRILYVLLEGGLYYGHKCLPFTIRRTLY